MTGSIRLDYLKQERNERTNYLRISGKAYWRHVATCFKNIGISVEQQTDYEKRLKQEQDKPNLNKTSHKMIKEMKFETYQVNTDKQVDFVVGYNFNDEKIFEYVRESVNIYYFTN